MNTNLLQKVENNYYRKVPKFSVGDKIAVHTIIREKGGTRIQIFKGLVIAIKGSGTRKTFTVRKISGGVGVEKIFPIHSPNIEKIEVTKKGDVRKSKIYYMRKRIGKSALKVKDSEREYAVEYEYEPEAETEQSATKEE